MHPVLKEALVDLILGWHLLLTWVFVTRIADEFILRLDALHAHDSFMDVGHHVLQLEDEEVPLILSPVWRAAEKCVGQEHQFSPERKMRETSSSGSMLMDMHP
jgi:hypothetical protein